MGISNFEMFCAAVSARNPLQKKFTTNALLNMAGNFRQDAEAYIAYCLSLGESIDGLVDAYLRYIEAINIEQLYFARKKTYRYSKLSEVEEIVYNNPDFMRVYLRGLALSLFLWPQHQEVRAFFHKKLPGSKKKNQYLEIGPGHGMFFLYALQQGGFDKYFGVDISPTSIAATRQLLSSGFFGQLDGYELVCGDFLQHEFGQVFSAIVIGEVLEHVEKPDLFIAKIAKIIEVGGFIFLSTCLNSAAITHIYNFENFEQIESLFAASGLGIQEKLSIPYMGKDIEYCLQRRYPMNVAYVLTKP